jgi:outer membrane lipoprotein carrier protein
MKMNLLPVPGLKFFTLRAAMLAVAVITVGLLAAGVPAAENGGAQPAQGAPKSAVLDRIQDHYRHTTSFSAKFTDEITGMGGTRRKRTGRVFYKRPGKMRWEFDPPQIETVVANGHKLYDYQPDLNQVIEMPTERAFKSAAPLAFLLGMGDIRRDFNSSLLSPAKSDPLLWVLLVPKSGGDRIEMGLDPATYDLMAVRVTDAMGNTTSIRFSAVRTNLQLADSLFNFAVPPGTDVVQAPGAPAQRL